MGFDVTEYGTRLRRPHKHRAVITACDEPTSIRTKHHCIYDGFVCKFAIAFLILKLVGHDKLARGVNALKKRPLTRAAEQKIHPRGSGTLG